MTDAVVTSDGIHMLDPLDLVEIVKNVEEKFTGWWWSISQKKIYISLTLGPGRNCPEAKDIVFAKTRRGDTGLSYLFHYENGKDTTDLLKELPGVFDLIIETRDSTPPEDLDDASAPVTSTAPHLRRQSEKALTALKEQYTSFLESIPEFEKNGRIFGEVYLGSCDFSVDCSLRGTRSDGKLFDISVDFTGEDPVIADSLQTAMDELNEDIKACISETGGS